MQLQVIMIRDIVADCYPFPPMFVMHLGSAIRDFGDQCKDKTTQLGKHPADYELFHAGTWDDKTGQVESIPQKQIAVGANYQD